MSTQNGQERKYGLFSLLALIVGVVIGAGIFVKNGSVYAATGSAVGSLIAWSIVSFIIFLMVFAFVEIASAGKYNGKPGTIAGWTSDFISPELGKWIGIFLVFVYFPGIVVMFPQWGADSILALAAPTLYEQAWSGSSIGAQWAYYGHILWISMILLGIIFSINLLSQSSSKTLGTVGMGIKTIPLFFVIISAFVFLGLGIANDLSLVGIPVPEIPLPEESFSITSAITSDSIGTYNATEGNGVSGILLAMPAILFTFDGFVFSASMQNEAKDQKTFMTAWVGGMIFVIFVYIMYSASIFWVTDGFEYSYTLHGAVHSIAPNQANWLWPLLQTMVIISIVSGFNGLFIGASKNMATLSAENVIADKDGNLMKYNSQSNAQYATYKLMGISAIWFAIIFIIDAILISTGVMHETYSSGGYQTNLATVTMFIGYSVVMLGGIWNRRTNAVEVDKKWYFIPTAIVASTFLILISAYQFYDIFASMADGAWYKSLILLAMIGMTVIPYLIYNKQHKEITAKELKAKDKHIEAFNNAQISNDFPEGFETIWQITPDFNLKDWFNQKLKR